MTHEADHSLQEAIAADFGGIDIYLFDQIQRGRVRPGDRVLDAGCGGGRNLHHLLRRGVRAFGVDRSPEAVHRARARAASLGVRSPAGRFAVGDVAALPFPDATFDLVLSSAVLHFAADEEDFARMLAGMWRVLRPGGLLWARLASSIGIEERVTPLGGRRFHLPDGTVRFLVDEAFLLGWTERLGAKLVDPIKTTNVQGARCMTTWVLSRTHRDASI